MILKKNQKEQPNLLIHIVNDFIKCFKVEVMMLFLIFCTAIAIVLITDASRSLVTVNDVLSEKREKLNEEWVNQNIEYSVLTESSRIENFAENKLNMKRPNTQMEVIVQKNEKDK